MYFDVFGNVSKRFSSAANVFPGHLHTKAAIFKNIFPSFAIESLVQTCTLTARKIVCK